MVVAMVDVSERQFHCEREPARTFYWLQFPPQDAAAEIAGITCI